VPEVPGYFLIPWLSTPMLAEILGFALGFLFGQAFKCFDENVKYGAWRNWFKEQVSVTQTFVSCFLDILHHFEYGIIIMLLVNISVFVPEALPSFLSFLVGLNMVWKVLLYAFGVGLVASDLQDYQQVLRRLAKVQAALTPKEEPSDAA